MKAPDEISLKIEGFKQRIELIENKRAEELGKYYKDRDHRLLRFLNREHRVYHFAMQTLEWALIVNNKP